METVGRRVLGYDRPEQLVRNAARETSKLAEAAPKGSIQRRVLDACLVKHFPSSIQTTLKKKGWYYPVAAHKLSAIKDYNVMAAGGKLSQRVFSRQRYTSSLVRLETGIKGPRTIENHGSQGVYSAE